MLVLTPPEPGRADPTRRRSLIRTVTGFATATLVAALVGPLAATPAQAANPVGQGFTVTPADLAFILKQIKIAETHVENTTSATGPCGALLGNGANQLPSPLLMFGLRTVDGSCNNLQPNRSQFGAADTKFPRHADPVFKQAEDSNIPGIGPVGPPGLTSYTQKTGSVVDSKPRTASNLIVDQTSTNPAAVAAAGFPVRTQHDPDRQPAAPCTTDPDPLAVPPVAAVPADCTPSHQTLFIPNVTTDVGLSPPYNSMFTLFGQFFDHGLDSVSKSGGTVFVPLPSDDPLIAGPNHQLGDGDDLPANKRFMVMTRAANGPGPDGTVGTADDEQNGTNRDSSFIDQSQTYSSHASHQVLLREYADNTDARPVSTGRLLGSADGGMATWALLKQQAQQRLGLQIVDQDVLNIPMIAADPYGKFIPGPARGLPQYVTAGGLVEGDLAADGGKGVPAPSDVRRIDTAFLDDIAHNAAPKKDGSLTPDADTAIGEPNAPQPAGTYDDELLGTHFTAGDGRTNENVGLTAIHQVFHSEHDRLVADVKRILTEDTTPKGVTALAQWKLAAGAEGWNGERLFQAARFITEMEYQHIAFEEFARKVQPGIEPFSVYHDNVNPAIKAEFAHAVYRFGHSMLTDTISRTNVEDGSSNDIGLLEGFLNPPAYTQKAPGGPSGVLTSEQAAGSIIMGMSGQVGNELDEFVTETLRNNLLGLPLDLATLNMARARETGVPSLNGFRRQLHASTNDSQLQPYTDWVDFGLSIKHPESLVNFVAAYGTHPSVTSQTTSAGRRTAAALLVSPPVGTDPTTIPADAADFMNGTGDWANTSNSTRTGLDDVDLWMGGLAERTNLFGGLLGSTFNYVFENQMTDLQNGDRFYYLGRTAGMNLRTQLEGNSFAELMMRTTDAHSLKADSFATADCKFQLGNLAGTGSTIADDPASECDESKLLIRMADGTIRYRTTNSVDPPGINGQSVFNGTSGADKVRGGVDNDTFLGNDGNDRIEGDDGADVAIGGDGNDIITDAAGDDVPKGGPGNDAIDAGPGLDIVMGGTGKDFTNGGANANETFGGDGDDMIIAGGGIDTVFGDSGSDWIQGGEGQDLLCGDSCAPFFDDPNKPGHDVLIGQNGEEDYDAEGGDDILIADAGVERNAGAGGYDWVTHERDTLAADADLTRRLALPLPANVLRDRYQEAEALSGGPLADTLRGDDTVPVDVTGGGLTGCDVLDQDGIDRIAGLGSLLPAPSSPLGPVEAASVNGECPLSGPVWGDGNVVLGGAGSDLMEGRGADDVLDGDRYLHVRLSVRTNPADAGTEIGSTDLMERPYKAGDPTTLQQAVFAGTVDPGDIVIVREILADPAATDVDTAQFSGPRADYDVTTTGSVTEVVHARGAATDGTDTLRNVERLRFSDTEISTPAEVVPAAPAAPTGISAVGGDGSATVTFTAPGDTGSSPITSFEVVAEAGGAVAGTVTGVAATATTAVVTGLTNGTAYTFRVRAVNAVGDGPLSAPSNEVTPAVPVTAPAAPSIGTASAASTEATVRWTAPASDGGSPITGYRVAVQVGATVARQVDVTDPAATSAVITGLTNGTAYTFQVRAINAIGLGTASASSNAVTPATTPDAPVIGLAQAGSGGGAITARAVWTAPPSNGGSAVTGYRVRALRISAAGAVVSTTLSTVQPAGARRLTMTLPGAGNYRFTVQAINAVGAGPHSARSNLVAGR